MRLLAYDPSGSFTEGKGTTGWSLWEWSEDSVQIITLGQIKATDYETKELYWKAHLDLIEKLKPNELVVENFKLYADKAIQQIGSSMETSKLIGVIEMFCAEHNIPITLQSASEVKKRWRDEILEHCKIIYHKNSRYYWNNMILSDHIRDSIRHGKHYITKCQKQLWKKNK
jgi:hypothetical protein